MRTFKARSISFIIAHSLVIFEVFKTTLETTVLSSSFFKFTEMVIQYLWKEEQNFPLSGPVPFFHYILSLSTYTMYHYYIIWYIFKIQSCSKFLSLIIILSPSYFLFNVNKYTNKYLYFLFYKYKNSYWDGWQKTMRTSNTPNSLYVVSY